MALVFRTDQSTPLTNDQVDNNFKYLRDQINTKYSTSDFTSANISLKLRTPGVGQSSYELSQANAINAWSMRDMEPLSGLPVVSDKSSIVSRDTYGNITVATVTGNLSGNADTATEASRAIKLTTARTINGVSFDGSANITVADSTKLPLTGGTLSGKLILNASTDASASINFGSSAIEPLSGNRTNGDMWATTNGFFYHVQGKTDQVAPIASPTFTGIPKAPGYNGIASQIITLTHLDNAVTTLNDSINLKAPLNSPGLTGTPTAPTANASSNNTTISTTAFVTNAVSVKASEIKTDYESYTTNAVVNYSNVVNGLLNLKANLNSPEFTGTPLAPTAPAGTSNTQLATTAFTTSAISAMQSAINSAINALQDAVNSTRPVPVGAVFYMAKSTVPYGYLEANGQAVSRTTYAALWQYLGSPNTGDGATTFNLPDYRGEFIRGWDHGRGVDTNREIGSIQYSQNLEHGHLFDDIRWSEVSGVYTYNDPMLGTISFGPGAGSNKGTDYDNGVHFKQHGTYLSGGSESRPRNVALMPIIKW